MGKKHGFLGFLATLFMMFVTANAFADGYTCPTIQRYTSCSTGYYMATSATNTTYNGTPAVGNACLVCPDDAVSCPGGTDAPVYEIRATKGTIAISTLGYYSVSAGFCTDAENCKTGGSSVVTAFTSLPTKSGYTFDGFYDTSGDTQHVTPNGVIVTNASSLSGPQTWYSHWTECPAGSYCDGSTPTAKESCPDGWQSDAGSTAQYNCYKTFVLNTNGATFATDAWSELGVPENPGFAQVTYDTTTSKFQVRVPYNTDGVRFVIPDSRTEPTGYTLSGGLGTASTCATGPTQTDFMTDASWAFNIFPVIENIANGSTIYLCRTPNIITFTYNGNNNTGGSVPARRTCVYGNDYDNCIANALQPKLSSTPTYSGEEFTGFAATDANNTEIPTDDLPSAVSAVKALAKSGSTSITMTATKTSCSVGYYCPADAQKTACPYGWTSDLGADNIEDCQVILQTTYGQFMDYEFVLPDNQETNSQGHACQQDGRIYTIYMNAPCKLPGDEVTKDAVDGDTKFKTTGYWGFLPLTADGEIDFSIEPTSEKAFNTIKLTVDSDAKTNLDASGHLFNDIFGENPDGATTTTTDIVHERKYLHATPVVKITCDTANYLPAGKSLCYSCEYEDLSIGAEYCPGGTFEFDAENDQGVESCSDLAGIPDNVNGRYSIVSAWYNQTAQTCRFTVDNITTVNGCTISGNTIEYDGTSWGTNYYTVTPELGYHSVNADTANPTCALNTLTINYNTNGATGGTPDTTTQTCEYGTDCTVAGRGTMEKTNMVFQGWDYNTDRFAPGENIKTLVTDLVPVINKTIELVANWQTPECSATNGTATLSSVTDNKPVCTITCDSGYTQGGASDTTTEFTITGNSGDTSVSGTCKASIYSCTAGKTHNGQNCPANSYCPGGNVAAGTEATDAGCARPCPADTKGGTVTSDTGSESISACTTTRTNIELENEGIVTGTGTQTCTYNENSKAYDADCNTEVVTCVAGYYYDTNGTAAICIPTALGHYSPDKDKQQYACTTLDGANDTTTTKERGSIITDCYNTCSTITDSTNHLTKNPVHDTIYATSNNGINGTIAACQYSIKCDPGYNNDTNENVCIANTITVGLDNDNDGSADSTVYLQYAGSWYNDSNLTEKISSITLPTSEAQTCSGYEYQGKQIVNSNGKFINNTFVTSGPVTITATWGDKPTVTCAAGTYYTGTGTTCDSCPAGSYCPGDTYYQNEGEKGIFPCPTAQDTGAVAAKDANGIPLTIKISSPEKASKINQCYATNLEYKSDTNQATGSQTCKYSNGKYAAECYDQKVYVCTGGYYLANNTDIDCVIVTDGWYSDAPTSRKQCPTVDGISGKTGTETATSIAQCYTEGVWYEPDENTGLRRTCYHTTADATTTGYITQCRIQNIVACNAGYYDDGVATRTNPDTRETERICAQVPQDSYSPGIAPADYAESNRPTIANETTQAYSCPNGGKTTGVGSGTSALACYIEDADCSAVIDNATTATGTCYYSAESETIGAGYTNCTASACTVTECADNYLVSEDGKSCYIDPNTCPEDYYCDEDGQHECPSDYPYSQSGSTSKSDCYKKEENCSCQRICDKDTITGLNSCTFPATYEKYAGVVFWSEDNNNTCVLLETKKPKGCPFRTITCKGNYYFNGDINGVWSCSLCTDLDSDYPYSLNNFGPYKSNNTDGAQACYRSVDLPCTKPICPLADRGTCDFNGTETQQMSGWKYYGDETIYPGRYVTPKMCTVTNWSCFVGYDKHADANIDPTDDITDATPDDLCTPHVYSIYLADNADQGDDTVNNTIYQKYLTGVYSDADATNEIVSIDIPTREYWTFKGYYTTPNALSNNAVQLIDANGNIVADTELSNAEYTADTTLYAWWTRNMTTCQIGMKYTGTDEVHDVCPKGEFCDGEGTTQIGTPGCFTECPRGGTTDSTGKTLVTDCYKIYNEGDTDDSGNIFDLANGSGYKKCYFIGDIDTGSYSYCTTTVETCEAGYYESTDATGLCSEATSGQYSPDGTKQVSYCAENNRHKLGSVKPRASQDDCYTICNKDVNDNTYLPTVPNSTYVNVQATSITQDSDENGVYGACLYDVECEVGYDPTSGATPACNAHPYTITLDKNGGTGNIADTVKCTFNSGKCELPSTKSLERAGYVPVEKWCTRADDTGTCYDAATNIDTNISADASDITLYAQWTPGIFKIELETPDVDGLTPNNNIQGPVYLKYNTGWYQDAQGTEPLVNLTDLGNALPALDGYVFGGYKLGDTSIINTQGVLQSSALTVVTDNSQTAHAVWSIGSIKCSAGTYYPGSGNECITCTQGYYCDKDITVGTNSGEAGRTKCLGKGQTATTGATSATECFITDAEYITTFDDNTPRAQGTQTCYLDGGGYTNCTYEGYENTVHITWCAGGHWFNENDTKLDCVPVGINNFSAVGDLTRESCPNNGNTGNVTTADSITKCIKNMPYESSSKNATGTCDRYSNTNGEYNSLCIDGTIVITKCAGGYWFDMGVSDDDCVDVGTNHYGPVAEDGTGYLIARAECPHGGTTDTTNAPSPIGYCRRSVDYPGDKYEGPDVHGSGTQSCAYAGQEYEEYDDGYINDCGTITINKCDSGYYWTRTEDIGSTDEVCSPVGVGYYGPVTAPNSASTTARRQCPEDAETKQRGTTDSNLSSDASACYVSGKSCTIGAAVGKTTCNYDSISVAYTDCEEYECIIDGCPAGTSLNTETNTCDPCEPGDYCPGGAEPAASCEANNDRFTQSDANATSTNDCYDECDTSDLDNASQVTGKIYRDGTNECTAIACKPGYYLKDGKCAPCEDGDYCPGGDEPAASCADNNDRYTQSKDNATSANECYDNCKISDLANASQVTGIIYRDGTNECRATECSNGYYITEQDLCERCPAGYFCDPDKPDNEPEKCPDGYTSDPGVATSIDYCYMDCDTDDVANATSVKGKDYYGNGTDTCRAITCKPGYYLTGDKCESCKEGDYCQGGDTKPEDCPAEYPNSDINAADPSACYRTCPAIDNAIEQTERDYNDPSGKNECQATKCDNGYYLSQGKCVTCPAGKYCDTTGEHDCPPTHPYSVSGENFAPGACYKTCSAIEIKNGYAKPKDEQVGYPDDCEYYGESESGNPCEIITVDNELICVETSCNYNFELVDGICQPCNREHALTYKKNGNCVVETCTSGYHPNGQACESDTRTCTAPNATAATQTWIPRANAFGECRILECSLGYHLADNVCQIDQEECRLPHGIGTREWDTKANTWGPCVATKCDPGYTSDPALTDELKTNEHWSQCGRCNNMFVQGEIAASAYVQECEIAACMYQGELFRLENNECHLICTEHADETGRRYWDPDTGRCEHACHEGYTPWQDAHGYKNRPE